MTDKGGAERRQNFRVRDQVLLDYDIISEAEMRGALRHIAVVDSAELGATTTLRRLETELQGALSVLQKDDKELARCLDLLNNKINALANLVPTSIKHDPDLKDRVVRNCNLSASGIAFSSHEAVELGAYVCIRMVVLPNYHHVVAYGEIVRVMELEEPEDGFTHEIGVHFEYILDRYREILARRALQREIEDLRVRRQEAEAEQEEQSNTG